VSTVCRATTYLKYKKSEVQNNWNTWLKSPNWFQSETSSLSWVNLLSFCLFQFNIRFDMWLIFNSVTDILKDEMRIKFLKLSPLRQLRSSPLMRLRFEKPLSHSTLEPGSTARIWQSLYNLVISINRRIILNKVWIYVRSHI